MPYTIFPPGYKAVLIGQAAVLRNWAPSLRLKQSSDEGALFLVRLDFAEQLHPQKLWLNWSRPSTKPASNDGRATSMWFMPNWLNLGLPGLAKRIRLAADHHRSGGYLVLPPLLDPLVWWILPQDIKNLITGIVNMG